MLPICACGCGLPTKTRRSKYLRGHRQISTLPLCACGCGEHVKKSNGNKPPKYLQGHHMKNKNSGKDNPFYGKTHTPLVRRIIQLSNLERSRV